MFGKARASSTCTIKRVARFATVCAALSVSALSVAQTKVVGYIPAYKNMRAVVDTVDLNKLTHINLSFLNPNASGVVANNNNPVCMSGASGDDVRYVVQKAHSAGVKVLVSVAGGVVPSCSGNWANLLQPNMRQTVVNNLVSFVNAVGLDGIDVDIEGVLLTDIDNAGNYVPFIQALDAALPAGKLLTSATASYNGGMVPTGSLPYFDFVNIMSYDSVGPWTGGTGAEHSSLATARSHINTWKARGLSKDKLVLGVPFYGYGFGSYGSDYTFAQIVQQFGADAAQKDVIGDLCAGCSYITYNGLPTIREKTRLAMQEGTGVMIWELSQDASGNMSLLNAISNELGGSGSSSSSSSSGSSSTSSSGGAGEQCNWWGTYFALCQNISDGWGWENNQDCVGRNTCATLPDPYGIVAGGSSSSSSGGSSSSSSSSSSGGSSCPTWVFGNQYYEGDVVFYAEDGGYYVAEHDNPGYIPTVSTYFWEPTSASACGGSSSGSSSSSSSGGGSAQVIQAENYSNMSGVQKEGTSDNGGGENVGWIDAGDWMVYNDVNFPATGRYQVEYRVASPSGARLALDLNGGSIALGEVAIPATGGWQNWTTVSHQVDVQGGTYTLGIYAPQSGWNLNWLRITRL